MLEIGQSSRSVEDEAIVKHVIWTEPLPAEPVPVVEPIGEESEQETDESSEEEDTPEGDELLGQLADKNMELEEENAELRQRLEESEQVIQQLRTEKQSVEEYWQEDLDACIELQAQLVRARQEVIDLEDEVRRKKVKIDRVTYAYRSSFGRLQSRVFYHPVEEEQSRHTISRIRVMAIADEEYEEAVHRGMHRF